MSIPLDMFFVSVIGDAFFVRFQMVRHENHSVIPFPFNGKIIFIRFLVSGQSTATSVHARCTDWLFTLSPILYIYDNSILKRSTRLGPIEFFFGQFAHILRRNRIFFELIF